MDTGLLNILMNLGSAGLMTVFALFVVNHFNRVNSNRQARRQAAINLIKDMQLSTEFKKLARAYSEVSDTPNGFCLLIDNDSEFAREYRQLIIAYLNFQEMICLGIRQGILDEEVCKGYFLSTMLRRWDKTSDLVAAVRKGKGGFSGSKRAFMNFEKISKKWKKR